MYFSKLNSLLILFVSVIAVLYALPNAVTKFNFNEISTYLPGKKVNLGLDLKGGSYILLQAEMKTSEIEFIDNTANSIRNDLRKEKIRYKGLNSNNGKITFRIRKKELIDRTKNLLEKYQVNFDISNIEDRFILDFSANGRKNLYASTLKKALEIVRRRIDESGTKEPLIQSQGLDRILVQLPGVDDPDRIKRLLGKTAKLSFRFTHPRIESNELTNSSPVPPGYILMNSENDRDVYYLIQKRVMISGEELIDANPGFDQDGNPAVMFALSTLGGKKFGRITGKNIGKPFAIVLDNKVISAPVIQGQIFSNGQITGNFSVQESRDLALVLRAGALPVPLTILEERSVGPGLGKDSIEAGKFASIIAIVVVMIFMLIYYGIYGLFANVSLIMNMVFLISVLTIIQATLTLPGIAGIVLTIGMAVDANVLIFERIREENLLRKNILESIDQGFKRAVSTIVDANLTTFIAAFALFIFGSGPIKGFSVTLMIGLITSMFTAIIITKYQIITYAKRQTRNI